MAIKFIFTSVLSLIGSSILSVQTTAAWQAEPLGDINTMNTVRQLEQNALMAIIGAVVLMGLMWICSVWKACAELNQQPKKANRHFITLFILVAGLSTFCCSCSVEQQAMA